MGREFAANYPFLLGFGASFFEWTPAACLAVRTPAIRVSLGTAGCRLSLFPSVAFPMKAPPAKRLRKDSGETSSLDSEASASPLVVFAHGAGAPSTSEWMIRWKEMLANALHAVEVVTFDYPYMSAEKRRAPPRAEKLVEYHSEMIKKAVEKYPGRPLVLAGKSMGSRVSCMVAGTGEFDVSAIVCLGYPLKGPGRVVRDETLLKLDDPIMFVQGSKDALCPLEKLSDVREKMKCHHELHVIDGGDHSFKIGKKLLQSNGTTQQANEEHAIEAIAQFVAKVVRK